MRKNLKSKIGIFNFILFFFLASQVYPFVYFHAHDHYGEKLFEICIHPSKIVHYPDHACQDHPSDHYHFSTGWDIIKQNDDKKDTLDLKKGILPSFIVEKTLSKSIKYSHLRFLKNGFFFYQLPNKAPPDLFES